MAGTHRLAIDLGTCHTVAVVRRSDDPPRALLFDGTPLLPSGVYAAEDGEILVGRDAERMLQVDPARFEPHPKRQIDDVTALLGDAEIPVVDLYRAILDRVAAEARDAGVDPTDATVLTCPSDWGPRRRGVLLAAAAAAGFGRVTLVEEPIAAATYCRSVLDQRIPAGANLAVFDFGGGTLDVTVIRQDASGPSVLAVGGLDDLGGVDCDAALAGHLGQAIGWRDQAVHQKLERPVTPAEHRDRRAFWAEVRAAKEMLSRASIAPVRVPGLEEAIHLTREELERVVRPLVDRAVDETRRVLDRAGVASGDGVNRSDGRRAGQELAGIFLVGGASRMPIVASRLHARFRVAPTVPEQPELPVAYGALLVADVVSLTPPTASPSVAADWPWPADPPPVSSERRPGPDQAAPPPAAPASQVPPEPTPAAAEPPPSEPPPSEPGFGGAHTGFPPRYGRVTQPPPVPVTKTRPSTRGRGRVMILLLLAITVGIPGYFGVKSAIDATESLRELGGTSANAGGREDGANSRAVATIGLPAGLASAMTVTDDALYYAVAGTDTTDVFAVAVAGGAQRWKTTIGVASGTMSLTTVGELLVVTAVRAPSNNNDDVRVVLDAKTGAQRWLKSWADMLDIAYLGTDVLVQRQQGTRTALERYDLLTGDNQWKRTPINDMYIIDSRISHPAIVASGTPGATGKPAANTDFDAAYPQPFGVDPSVTAELAESGGRIVAVSAGDGGQRATGAAPLEADEWTVFGGLAIGRRNDVSTSLTAYRLSDVKQAWEYRVPAGADFEMIRPCGDRLVCASVAMSSGPGYLAAIDVDSGAERWRYTPEGSSGSRGARWSLVGGRLLVGQGATTTLSDSVLLDPATGKKTATLSTKTNSASVWTISGSKLLTVGSVVAGGWRATVIDADTGKAIVSGDAGKAYPKRAVISATAFAVLGADGAIRLYALPSQAKKP